MRIKRWVRKCGGVWAGWLVAVGVVAAPVQADPAFRAVWVDAIYEGFKTTAQIDALVARAQQGNYNAIVAQVMNYQEASGYRGAYWNSSLVPKSPAVASGLDPLAYLCTKAHAAGIEVHAWLVTYRASNNWPPTGNSLLAAHPEWVTVPRAAIGGGPVTLDGHYFLDPGSPDVQEHLISIVRELVTNYPIDGINWDYIRYTQQDAGYPADSTYANSGLARFQRLTGTTEVPAANDSAWSDFRRRTIDELVRRCRMEIAAITSNPRQPLRMTGCLFCPGSASTNFTSTSAYILHQNWKHWVEMGWLDAGTPMNYKNEATYASAYRTWIDRVMSWRADRHMYCGQANYLNTMANSLAQMQYIYAAGAHGSVNYSYYSTTSSGNDWTWYPYMGAQLFTTPASTPTMPWWNPATATEGFLWGRVTDADTGEPIEDATVQAGSLPAVYTDGNGYYVISRIPASEAGTDYVVTAGRADYPAPVTHEAVTVTAGGASRDDFAISMQLPCEDTLLSGFEGYAVGSQVMFRPPRFSGSTSEHLLTSPNVSEATDAVEAFNGTRSCRLAWQFVDNATSRWVRVTTSNAANLPNPTIRLDRPVRIRLRLDAGSLLVTLGVRETGTTAAIGADGGTTGTIELLGASEKIGSAPQGKLLVGRPGMWQTLIFDPASDPIIAMTGDGELSSATGKGTIENLAFASTGQFGPFNVYLDEIEQICTVAQCGDLDGDGDVDSADVIRFRACLTGADLAVVESCRDADLDGDGDVDLADFGFLQRCLSGSAIAADPACGR